MPPKKTNEPPPPPPRPPTPPNPAVIAAQGVVEKWEKRVEDLENKLKTTQQYIEELEAQSQQRESTVRSLYQQVVTVTTPRAAEPEPAAKGAKKPVKGVPEPPPVPTPDEEELKRQAKTAAYLQNLFKKKKENFRVRDTPNDDGSERVEEMGVAKPPEIDDELWQKVLAMRDERIQHEEALLTMRSNIETLTARKEGLRQIEKLVAYSLAGARERLEQVKAAPPPMEGAAAGDIAPGVAAAQLAAAPRPPSNNKPTNRPPSQLLRR